MDRGKLNVGDTIKCYDAHEMVSISEELAKEDIVTDFLYEKDNQKGFWLTVTATCIEVPSLKEVKSAICDEYCRFPFVCASQEELLQHCENCPLDKYEE